MVVPMPEHSSVKTRWGSVRMSHCVRNASVYFYKWLWRQETKGVFQATGKSILTQTSIMCEYYFKLIKGILKRRPLWNKQKNSFATKSSLPFSNSISWLWGPSSQSSLLPVLWPHEIPSHHWPPSRAFPRVCSWAFVFPTRQLPAPLLSPISSTSLTPSAFLSLTPSAGAPDGRNAWCSRKSGVGISANNGLFLCKEIAQRLKILHCHNDFMRKRLLLYPFNTGTWRAEQRSSLAGINIC